MYQVRVRFPDLQGREFSVEYEFNPNSDCTGVDQPIDYTITEEGTYVFPRDVEPETSFPCTCEVRIKFTDVDDPSFVVYSSPDNRASTFWDGINPGCCETDTGELFGIGCEEEVDEFNSQSPTIANYEVPLTRRNGAIAFYLETGDTPSKFEIFHNGIKVATTHMQTLNMDDKSTNYGFPRVNDFDPIGNNGIIPTEAQADGNDFFIANDKSTPIPQRYVEFEQDTPYTIDPTIEDVEQLIWWEFTTDDFDQDDKVTLKVTGPVNSMYKFNSRCYYSFTPETSTEGRCAEDVFSQGPFPATAIEPNGVDHFRYTLDPEGGVFTAYIVANEDFAVKYELIHLGQKVATTHMKELNSDTNSTNYGFEENNEFDNFGDDNNAVTDQNTQDSDFFIEIDKPDENGNPLEVPSRRDQYEADTGETYQYATSTDGVLQVLWFNYTSIDAARDSNIYLRRTMQPEGTSSATVFCGEPTPQPEPGCDVTTSRGASQRPEDDSRIIDTIELDSPTGGVVALYVCTYDEPDKVELLHDGNKVATTHMFTTNDDGVSTNYGFPNTGDFSTLGDDGRVPSSTETFADDFYIGNRFSQNRDVPDRGMEFEADTGQTFDPNQFPCEADQPSNTFSQIVWFKYTAEDFNRDENLTIIGNGASNTAYQYKIVCFNNN